MNMSEHEEVREVLVRQVCQKNGWERGSEEALLAEEEVDWWLSLPHIAVLAKDQALPVYRYRYNMQTPPLAYIEAQHDMSGFRRIVEKVNERD